MMAAADVPTSHSPWPSVCNQLKTKLWGVAER